MTGQASNHRFAKKRPSSGLTALLARLWPRLAFDEPLETQFRSWHVANVRSRMRHTLWIVMCGLLVAALAGGPFERMRAAIFGLEANWLITALRYGLILPSCLAVLLVTHTALYDRWYALTTQIVLPIHVVCFVVMNAAMHEHGYSLASWMPLVMVSPYFLFAMMYEPAVRTSLIVMTIYVGGSHIAGLTGGQHYFDLLVAVIASIFCGAIHYAQQKSARHDYLATRLLHESVNRDALTGIHNRRMFDEHIGRLWQQATREKSPLALLLVDLDHFKTFNDFDGHQAGDVCLVKVANVLPRAARRPLDLSARYGGEEFIVLLYDARRDYVEEVCRQLHANLASLAIPHPASPLGRLVTFSIGAALVVPQPGRSHEGFIQLADEALYAAKDGGRNRTVIMDREYETLQTGSFRAARVRGNAAA
jgi:diguanylate cyclase (GGDEF)-like protein